MNSLDKYISLWVGTLDNPIEVSTPDIHRLKHEGHTLELFLEDLTNRGYLLHGSSDNITSLIKPLAGPVCMTNSSKVALTCALVSKKIPGIPSEMNLDYTQNPILLEIFIHREWYDNIPGFSGSTTLEIGNRLFEIAKHKNGFIYVVQQSAEFTQHSYLKDEYRSTSEVPFVTKIPITESDFRYKVLANVYEVKTELVGRVG